MPVLINVFIPSGTPFQFQNVQSGGIELIFIDDRIRPAFFTRPADRKFHIITHVKTLPEIGIDAAIMHIRLPDLFKSGVIQFPHGFHACILNNIPYCMRLICPKKKQPASAGCHT